MSKCALAIIKFNKTRFYLEFNFSKIWAKMKKQDISVILQFNLIRTGFLHVIKQILKFIKKVVLKFLFDSMSSGKIKFLVYQAVFGCVCSSVQGHCLGFKVTILFGLQVDGYSFDCTTFLSLK